MHQCPANAELYSALILGAGFVLTLGFCGIVNCYVKRRRLAAAGARAGGMAAE